MTNYAHKNVIRILPNFSVIKFFQKVEWVFDFGHFFMSIFEKPKKVLKKTLFSDVSDHNALIFIFL